MKYECVYRYIYIYTKYMQTSPCMRSLLSNWKHLPVRIVHLHVERSNCMEVFLRVFLENLMDFPTGIAMTWALTMFKPSYPLVFSK